MMGCRNRKHPKYCFSSLSRTEKNLGIAPRTRRKAALKANVVLRPERIPKGGRCVAQRILSDDCRWQSLYEIIGFADSASLRPHSFLLSWRDKKEAPGGTQLKCVKGFGNFADIQYKKPPRVFPGRCCKEPIFNSLPGSGRRRGGIFRIPRRRILPAPKWDRPASDRKSP